MRQFLILFFCFYLSIDICSQELDDMYFTGSDRSSKNKLKNKVTPARNMKMRFKEQENLGFPAYIKSRK